MERSYNVDMPPEKIGSYLELSGQLRFEKLRANEAEDEAARLRKTLFRAREVIHLAHDARLATDDAWLVLRMVQYLLCECLDSSSDDEFPY